MALIVDQFSKTILDLTKLKVGKRKAVSLPRVEVEMGLIVEEVGLEASAVVGLIAVMGVFKDTSFFSRNADSEYLLPAPNGDLTRREFV